MRLGRTQQNGVTRLPAELPGRPAAIYSNSVIDPYSIKAYSLEHKQCYNIVIGKEKYIYILQQVRRDILLSLCIFVVFVTTLWNTSGYRCVGIGYE